MTEAPDTIGRRVKWKRYLRWGLRLAGMACWTILVGGASCILLIWIGFGAGSASVYGPERQQWYQDMMNSIMVGGSVLALAPWVIGGIVLGIRWWKSRATPRTQATE